MGCCFSTKPERVHSIQPYTPSRSTRAFEIIDKEALALYKVSVSSVVSSTGKHSQGERSIRKGTLYTSSMYEYPKKETEPLRISVSYPNLRKIYFTDTQ